MLLSASIFNGNSNLVAFTSQIVLLDNYGRAVIFREIRLRGGCRVWDKTAVVIVSLCTVFADPESPGYCLYGYISESWPHSNRIMLDI